MTNYKLQITNDFKGKKILVMGLGLHGGGAGTVKFLAKCGAKVTVTDLHPENILRPSLRELARFKNIKYVLGRHRKKEILEAGLIVKNPGVPPASPYLKLARKYRIPVTSDVGIFFRLCPGKIIGVTGTRGKSTTAYLIYKLLQAGFARRSRALTRRRRVWLGGNIRTSVLELLPKIKKGDWVVLELSSFQLQDLAQEEKSPPLAILTNVYRDHLNWHGNFKNYVRAKSYIFSFQHKNDYLFANPDDKTVRIMVRNAPARVAFPRLPKTLHPVVDRNIGQHYRSSVALALACARHLGVAQKSAARALKNFRGLEGRQEHVAAINGVHFINDTTATIPEAAIAAIKRFRPLAGSHKLILIAGGQDKKLDFEKMMEAIKKSVEVLVLLPGTATDKVKSQKSKVKSQKFPVYEASSMEKAVKTAWRQAAKGDYIILSPGAASFGLFFNEFDRGKQFADAVRKLK